MPQMAPIWWMTLYSLIMISLIMMITILYYQKMPLLMNMNYLNNKIKSPNWKW
uniref:ATP synthase complex subunit 8 n=1 Tax=Physoderes impexa TaxID=1239050 RepID=A0A7I6H8F6_9HEMI|nr:ATP synthase F0 subunit 8 [Physoderes impexa]AGO28081.1 ATP synthase F0 subunit 8 [Physoderes impexa]